MQKRDKAEKDARREGRQAFGCGWNMNFKVESHQSLSWSGQWKADNVRSLCYIKKLELYPMADKMALNVFNKGMTWSRLHFKQIALAAVWRMDLTGM